MILSMLYLMDYERIYKTQDLVLATTTGKKMMEKKMLAGTLCGLFYLKPVPYSARGYEVNYNAA